MSDGIFWHVLHTKSRQEKALAKDLVGMGVEVFLPVTEEVRLYGKRKAKVELPLFPGYVFLRGTLEQAYDADRTGRVARIIRAADQEQLGWELSNLRRAVANRVTLEPYPFLRKGVRVEVRSGPFSGLQGVIEDRADAGRLILQVETLGRALSLELDGAVLEVIE